MKVPQIPLVTALSAWAVPQNDTAAASARGSLNRQVPFMTSFVAPPSDPGVALLSLVDKAHLLPMAALPAPRNVMSQGLTEKSVIEPTLEKALRNKLSLALPESSMRNLTLTRQGYAGAYTVLAHGDRGDIFAKVFLHWPENKGSHTFQRELFGAAFGGNTGLSPRLLYASPEQGLLLTEPSNNLYPHEKDCAKDPCLRLSWGLLNTLRAASQDDSRAKQHVNGTILYEKFETELNLLSPKKRADARLELVADNADKAVNVYLHGRSYAPSLVHGDFQQGNILVDSETRAYLIDWETFREGDASVDFVEYLMRIQEPAATVVRHASALPLFTAADVQRAQLYLVYERAREFIGKSQNGRPWDVPELREAELAAMYTQVQADSEWLATLSS